MKIQLTAIVGAACALLATPASAQTVASSGFTGARVGVTVGTGGNDFVDFDGQTVGLELGYDFDNGSTVAGVGVEYQTDLGDEFLDINETALLFRAGAKVGPTALVYATGGISVLNSGSTPFSGVSEEGVRAGLGAEFALGGGGTSFKVEQRYYNYGNNVDSFQTVAGIGIRF